MCSIKKPFSDGKDNPKFQGLIQLIDAAIKEGLIQQDPYNKNNIIVYCTDLDESLYGIKEGWCSANIIDTMREMKSRLSYGNRKDFDSFIKALKNQGYVAEFSNEGDFLKLRKNENENEEESK